MGAPFWLAVALALAAMVALAFFTERVVLRPLVNQPQITLFMATIGLAFLIEGVAQLTGALRCTPWIWASPTSRSIG